MNSTTDPLGNAQGPGRAAQHPNQPKNQQQRGEKPDEVDGKPSGGERELGERSTRIARRLRETEQRPPDDEEHSRDSQKSA